MKYKIRAFDPPHVVVEYQTDDELHKAYLNVRIDRKLDGTLPEGAELDAYILSYAPLLGQPDPYEGVDWSGVAGLVETLPPTVEQQKATILMQLQTIDAKSIRALREGDAARVESLEQEAVALRAQLAGL